jgi:two-component system OmpR family sensor kinase
VPVSRFAHSVSLRTRLVLPAAGVIVLAVALFATATVLVVGSQLRGSLDQALRQRAEQVAQLAVSAPAVLTDPGALESRVGGRQIDVEVIDAHGRIIARSQALGALLLPEGQLARGAVRQGRTGFGDVRIAGAQYRLFAAPIAQAGGPAAGGAVLVASDTTDITHTVSHLGLIIALSGAVAALLAALAAAMLTSRGLRPLRRLAAGAAEIERTADPSRRLPEPASADEIGALTGVLNRMLASLDRARSSERRFLADASHELRTPVTALRGNVEYAIRHGAGAEVLADLRHDADRLARLVDDLLVLERAGAPADLTPVALDELAAAVAGDHERVVLGTVEAARVRGDRDALVRALSNLIDNALVHGPADGLVTVDVRAQAGRARVTVSDEGPGPADPARVFERFWRAPEAAERPGSGLGLSIVQAIAERHGGSVVLDGAAFTIELPLSEAQPPGSPVEFGKRSLRA